MFSCVVVDYHVALRMISMVYWIRICEARFETGSVVDITRAHLSQRKIVQHMGTSVSPTSVRETDGSERWIITCFLCAKVNCDTDFRKVGVIWIVWETFVIILVPRIFIFSLLNDLETMRLFV